MISWLRQQKRAFTTALCRLGKQPVSTVLAALALGVAISLPSGLYLVLANLDRLAGDLPAQPEISLFLNADISDEQKRGIETRLKRSDVAQARFVDKDQALVRLTTEQDLRDITAGLTENPLPDAWVVRLQSESRQDVERTAAELGALQGVAETHLDNQWADRLQAGLAIGRTAVGVLAGLFAIALIAITGNVIRAQVLVRHDEIQVSRLIGATARYIRRPFLYVGALQGLFGGFAAGGVLAVAGAVLQEPIERLAGLYGSTFYLQPLGALEILIVLGLTTLFGWIGAWISVTRALRKVETY